MRFVRAFGRYKYCPQVNDRPQHGACNIFLFFLISTVCSGEGISQMWPRQHDAYDQGLSPAQWPPIKKALSRQTCPQLVEAHTLRAVHQVEACTTCGQSVYSNSTPELLPVAI